MGCNGLGVNLICPYVSFFDRLQQQSLKLHWKRAQEAKRIYDSRCREEVACNQVYHQEIARSGKSSREADKVRQKYSYRLRLRHIGFSLGTQFTQNGRAHFCAPLYGTVRPKGVVESEFLTI